MTAPRTTLPIIDDRVEARARATREAHPWWPCAKGCDHCCRSLPHLPTITRAEWDRLAEALHRLPDATRGEIRTRAAEAPEHGPLTCPMLEREHGTCLVYEARPVACRTYGFYTERDAGLHCAQVMRAVAEHEEDGPIVWGNGEAITADMRRVFGEVASLREWMA